MGRPRLLFRLFSVFFNITTSTTNWCEKMSIQCTVLGFEPMMFRKWASLHNHISTQQKIRLFTFVFTNIFLIFCELTSGRRALWLPPRPTRPPPRPTRPDHHSSPQYNNFYQALIKVTYFLCWLGAALDKNKAIEINQFSWFSIFWLLRSTFFEMILT